MDARRFSAIAHGELLLWNPIDPIDVDRSVARLGQVRDVLDVGCGPAEILARVLLAHPEATGVGVDDSPFAIAAARKNLARHDLAARARLVEGRFDGKHFGPASVDAAICVGALHAIGALRDALEVLSMILRPRGSLLFGHGYWRREPDPEYLAAIGGTRNELGTHEENLIAIRSAGYGVDHGVETSQEAFERYEETYAANVRGFLRTNPDDPDVPAMKERIDRWQAAYQKWGRETMGFALYLLTKPSSG